MDELTPEGILAAVSETYRGFVEYEDVGVVSDGATPSVRFETRFRRGSLLRFAYTAYRPDGQKYHEGSVTSEHDHFSFSCSLGGPQPTSLRLGSLRSPGSRGGQHTVFRPSCFRRKLVGGYPLVWWKSSAYRMKLLRELRASTFRATIRNDPRSTLYSWTRPRS